MYYISLHDDLGLYCSNLLVMLTNSVMKMTETILQHRVKCSLKSENHKFYKIHPHSVTVTVSGSGFIFNFTCQHNSGVRAYLDLVTPVFHRRLYTGSDHLIIPDFKRKNSPAGHGIFAFSGQFRSILT